MPDTAVRTLISESTVRQLAKDIARDLYPLGDILKVHKLDIVQYEQIVDSKLFQSMLDEELAVWASDTKSRVRHRALTILEESLAEIYTRIHDPGVVLSAKVEALKMLARLAQMEADEGGVRDGEKVVFNITIGGEQKRYVQEKSDPKVIDLPSEEVTQGVTEPAGVLRTGA